MEKKLLDFIQTNSPDGGFLQSVYWRKFQESVERKTFDISGADENGELIAFANIIEHTLPVVGKYFYVPRGPIIENFKFQISNFKSNPNDKIKKFINDLISLAKKENINWIRVEPVSNDILQVIKENLPENIKIKKAPVNVQPREILVIDIARSEEEILSEMKQKTRYNIRLAEKKGVRVFASREKKYIDEFLRLVKITSARDRITAHSEDYYRKMFETISPEILKLYVAEYGGKIISANLVLFFGKTATYMHGASDNEHRNLMAPYLLQWRQIIDAKKAGCERYDFGGMKTMNNDQRSMISSWAGITKFKTGFAPDTKPIEFPGCWDIVLKPRKYLMYRMLRKIKP